MASKYCSGCGRPAEIVSPDEGTACCRPNPPQQNGEPAGEVRRLRDENARLRKIVAEVSAQVERREAAGGSEGKVTPQEWTTEVCEHCGKDKVGISIVDGDRLRGALNEVERLQQELRDAKDEHLYDVHHLRRKITSIESENARLRDPANWSMTANGPRYVDPEAEGPEGEMEDWIREKIASEDGSIHPGRILMAEDTPPHFDPVALQFAFWRMVSTGQIKLNRNRSVSLPNQSARQPGPEAKGGEDG